MTRKMKDSGIKWIDEIPKEWEILRVKQLFKLGRGRVIAKTELDEKHLYPVYSSQTKNNGILGYIETYDFEGPRLTWTTDGANAGTVFIRDGKYNCTNVCGTLDLKDEINNLRYLKYTLEYIAIFHKRADTNGYKIMNNEMANIEIVLPSLLEQKSIADFLDDKTQEIDNIISKTKKAIEEYKKYKQSLITNTVIKGLDKNIPMKDSEIEWIEAIPEHWEVRKLKYIFNIKKDIANELGYDVLSITQKGLKIRDLSSNEGQLSMDYRKYQIVNKNDFAMNHMDLLTGWVDLSKTIGVTSPDYRVFNIEDTSKYKNEYYLKLLQLCYTNKIFYGSGQGVSNLGRWRLQTEAFNNIYYPVPPLKEQEEIAAYLDKKCSQIDQIISTKQKLLIEMEAYKKSLIYETVTGKREVQ